VPKGSYAQGGNTLPKLRGAAWGAHGKVALGMPQGGGLGRRKRNFIGDETARVLTYLHAIERKRGNRLHSALFRKPLLSAKRCKLSDAEGRRRKSASRRDKKASKPSPLEGEKTSRKKEGSDRLWTRDKLPQFRRKVYWENLLLRRGLNRSLATCHQVDRRKGIGKNSRHPSLQEAPPRRTKCHQLST